MSRPNVVRKLVLEHGLHLSWAVSLFATLGSLYLSEIRGFIPCNLCWYQRIAMYPLVVLLALAAWRKDYGQSKYVLAIASIGWIISTLHYLMQKTDLFHSVESAACGIVPCTGIYMNLFGFVTIPFMAWVAFTVIIILQISIMRAAAAK